MSEIILGIIGGGQLGSMLAISAKKLNINLLNYFDENQIYRIDHYLGKETVQNLLVLRFSNSLWEPLWNNKYIDHVQITKKKYYYQR